MVLIDNFDPKDDPKRTLRIPNCTRLGFFQGSIKVIHLSVKQDYVGASPTLGAERKYVSFKYGW